MSDHTPIFPMKALFFSLLVWRRRGDREKKCSVQR